MLLHEPPTEENENVTRGVEIHAKVEKKAVTLVIQKVIEGIKVRYLPSHYVGNLIKLHTNYTSATSRRNQTG